MSKPHSITTKREKAALARSLIAAADVIGGRSFVELGTRHAGTSYWVDRTLKKIRDRPFSFYGLDFAPFAARRWKKAFAGIENPPKLLQMTTVAALDEPMDALVWAFVDACHCFECVIADITGWGDRLIRGGYLVVHDTTARRKNYTKNFQHYGPNGYPTRPYGVWQALQPDAPAGKYLRESFALIEDVDDVNGIQVWRKEA